MTNSSRPVLDWSLPLPRVLHATGVCVAGTGAMIIGPSGTGKSSLALQMMALGAGLVSDDLTQISQRGSALCISSPAERGAAFRIEARGLGILNAPSAGEAKLACIVDLTALETARLPEQRLISVAGHPVPILRRVDSPAFPAMLVQFLRHGRQPL